MKTKKKFPKISEDTLQEVFIQTMTRLGEAFMRLDKLEADVGILKGGYITINEDEEYKKTEKHHQSILDGVDDSEEFTKKEFQEIKQLAEEEYIKCCGIHYAGGLKDIYDRIYYKANKMLKEKE